MGSLKHNRHLPHGADIQLLSESVRVLPFKHILFSRRFNPVKVCLRHCAQTAVKTLQNLLCPDYGYILRAKGMVPCDDGQTWLHFDLVPEEFQIREGAADYTGRLCVIGSGLDEAGLEKLFQLV